MLQVLWEGANGQRALWLSLQTLIPEGQTCTCLPACRWLGGAYWMLITMLSVGYGDISPKTETEIIITMFATIAGIVFFGILLGSIAEALTVSPPLPFWRMFCQYSCQ